MTLYFRPSHPGTYHAQTMDLSSGYTNRRRMGTELIKKLNSPWAFIGTTCFISDAEADIIVIYTNTLGYNNLVITYTYLEWKNKISLFPTDTYYWVTELEGFKSKQGDIWIYNKVRK